MLPYSGDMPRLPRSDSSLLVRTDFTGDDAWQQVSDEAQWENADGFRAYIVPVSDPAFDPQILAPPSATAHHA
jgi:hypothetical protein